MSKTHKVEVTVEFYWHGDLGGWQMGEAVETEIAMGNFSLSLIPIKELDHLSQKVLDSYPYGEGGNEKTIAQWLAEEKNP